MSPFQYAELGWSVSGSTRNIRYNFSADVSCREGKLGGVSASLRLLGLGGGKLIGSRRDGNVAVLTISLANEPMGMPALLLDVPEAPATFEDEGAVVVIVAAAVVRATVIVATVVDATGGDAISSSSLLIIVADGAPLVSIGAADDDACPLRPVDVPGRL